MLDTAQLQQLKRTNISQDPEKTQQRARELWQSLKNKEKQALKDLADVTSQTIYRIYENGGISARLAIAFAQCLNVSPFYLTGETDARGACSDAVIRELLLKYGYQKLVASMELPEAKPKRPAPPPKPAVEEAPAEATEGESVPAEEFQPQPEPVVQLSGSEALTAEDLQPLICALYIQAKAGIAKSKEKLGQIKQILLS